MLKAVSVAVGLALIAVVGYNLNLHGSFQKSSAGKFVQESGASEYASMVWEQAKIIGDRSAKWAIVNVPVYYNESCVYLAPYLQLGKELSLIIYNSSNRVLKDVTDYVALQTPIVNAWVQEKMPVIKDSCNNALSVTKQYAGIALDNAAYYTESTVKYAKKNIFVGSMSPENLQRYTMEALNTTQTLATNTMHWVYEKIQSIRVEP